MNHSYTGLIFIIIVFSVYAFYTSNSAYVSEIKGKYYETSSKIGFDPKTRWRRAVDKSAENPDNVTGPLELFNNLPWLSPAIWSEEIVLNICCGPNQQLNASDNECIDVNTTASSRIDFVLDNFVVNSDMGRGLIISPQFVYGADTLVACGNEEII